MEMIFSNIIHVRQKFFRDIIKIRGKILRVKMLSIDEMIRDIIHYGGNLYGLLLSADQVIYAENFL